MQYALSLMICYDLRYVGQVKRILFEEIYKMIFDQNWQKFAINEKKS